ncbi:NAD-dependent malic enzyme [Colwellia ponticola]|uniref:NAD-dependent malic enzyme n=1 Tax=Colwellia ponticola TaxID=2304625 RepID=A0A8H2PN17_9GAMM|nr:NAD-dependent malic enzyme [Colwellia ponticola]TMM47567.1 NAD-dependent malic enzyme [Colwellia ponticola]
MSQSKRPLYIPYAGPTLLETPLLNKGSAFSKEERGHFNLTGLLPPRFETIDEQVDRAYLQYNSFKTNINKHIYLRAIHDNNETLFFKVVQRHLAEMMPIIYTPTVGDACEQFSDIYRSSRGLFISYADRFSIDDILRNATKNKVKVIVVTDGERILGLGDQGIGGMGIPIGKLSLYTSCGGISPAHTLPIMLDVGTNNQKLLDDPMYMGARHKRIDQDSYDEFLELFVSAIKRRWPQVLLQFEDFAQPNAMPLLERYKDKICCFNDDIQGTASVSVGTLLAACRSKGVKLSDQRVAFVGAGSAGCGIAEQIISQMISEGITPEDARSQVFMIDRFGLLTEGMEGLRDFQEKLVQSTEAVAHWDITGKFASLVEVMHGAKPDILIGVSGQAGLFTEEVITSMKSHCELPIIFPLSNPSRQVEATPTQVINWTKGQVIIATGSPFEPVVYEGKTFPIAQCNNSYIFPGIGLAVVTANISRITEEMLQVASETLAAASPLANNESDQLLPPLTAIAQLSKEIAFAIAKVAYKQGLALELTDEQLLAKIERNYWQPEYRQYRRVSI